MKDCRHAHGEYSDDYRHCLDCGMEWVYISPDWFPVIGWLRMDKRFLGDATTKGDGRGHSRSADAQ